MEFLAVTEEMVNRALARATMVSQELLVNLAKTVDLVLQVHQELQELRVILACLALARLLLASQLFQYRRFQ